MYGWDTHSWRNSTEHRQVKREVAAATAAYLAAPPPPESVEVRPQCMCSAREWPHDPQEIHGEPWPRVWKKRTP